VSIRSRKREHNVPIAEHQRIVFSVLVDKVQITRGVPTQRVVFRFLERLRATIDLNFISLEPPSVSEVIDVAQIRLDFFPVAFSFNGRRSAVSE